jgi:hypothetical protein
MINRKGTGMPYETGVAESDKEIPQQEQKRPLGSDRRQ